MVNQESIYQKAISASSFETNWWKAKLPYIAGACIVLSLVGWGALAPLTKPKAATLPPVVTPKVQQKEVKQKPNKVKSSLDLVKVESKGYSTNLTPAAISELPEKNVASYIQAWTKTAIYVSDKTGVPASIILGQAIVESRAGTSALSQFPSTVVMIGKIAVQGANNHFGHKCFGKSCPKGHCRQSHDDNWKDFFKVYKDANECFVEHGIKISTGRYKPLLAYGKNYKAWAKGLKDFGYATDQKYDEKLIAVIERNSLQNLDTL